MVSGRDVAENLNASVSWDEVNNAVVIKSNNINDNTNDINSVNIENNTINNPLINNSIISNNENNQIETLKDYYIQGDIPCIKYNNTVYVPLVAGMNYYKYLEKK
jgi:hypothetical protein